MNTCSPFITPPLPFCSQTISWVAQWHNYKQCHIYNIYIIIFICTYLYFFIYFYFTFPCAGKSNKMADSADSFSGFFWNSIHKTLIPTRRHVERPLEYFSEVAAVLVFKINKGAFENITSIWNWNSNLCLICLYFLFGFVDFIHKVGIRSVVTFLSGYWPTSCNSYCVSQYRVEKF